MLVPMTVLWALILQGFSSLASRMAEPGSYFQSFAHKSDSVKKPPPFCLFHQNFRHTILLTTPV